MLKNMLKKLIERKYYVDKQTILDLLNNFMAFEQINIEEYSELMLLIEDAYKIIIEEIVNIEIAEETNELEEE